MDRLDAPGSEIDRSSTLQLAGFNTMEINYEWDVYGEIFLYGSDTLWPTTKIAAHLA